MVWLIFSVQQIVSPRQTSRDRQADACDAMFTKAHCSHMILHQCKFKSWERQLLLQSEDLLQPACHLTLQHPY
jgi:hypothetical protein